MKLLFNQSHPNGQKIHAWKPKAYSNETFDQKNKKVFTLSDSYYQIVNSFSGFISSNIDNFRELLPNDTTHFFRAHIKQYSHFQRVTTKKE